MKARNAKKRTAAILVAAVGLFALCMRPSPPPPPPTTQRAFSFVITKLPEHGTLRVNGRTLTEADLPFTFPADPLPEASDQERDSHAD